jgi:serine/threonine-protein phosphatase 5
LKIENYGFAIADATKAIELDPKMAKAYYRYIASKLSTKANQLDRRGCAHYFLGKLELALSDFKSAIQNAPADKEARDKFEQCKKAKQQKL